VKRSGQTLDLADQGAVGTAFPDPTAHAGACLHPAHGGGRLFTRLLVGQLARPGDHPQQFSPRVAATVGRIAVDDPKCDGLAIEDFGDHGIDKIVHASVVAPTSGAGVGEEGGEIPHQATHAIEIVRLAEEGARAQGHAMRAVGGLV